MLGRFQDIKGKTNMPTGTVKWFNNAKGFGFILPDAGGDDIFAHYSAIEMDGYRTLKAGQAVSYDVAQGDKGLHATHIRLDGAQKAQSPEDCPESGLDEGDASSVLAETVASQSA